MNHLLSECLQLGLMRCVGLIFLLATTALPLQGQRSGSWRGKKCAVVLTYDDALNVDLDNVVPLLDSLGFKATFYVPGSFPGFRERLNDWKSVAKEGHELGNHSLFHPCDGNLQGRNWVPPDYDLKKYTVRRMVDELKQANTLLEALDGKTRRTFAYPCGEMKAGDSSYVRDIQDLFVGARGVEGKLQSIDDIDLYNICAYMINGESGDELIRLVNEAMTRQALLVFLFHGVGGEHSLNVSLQDHRELLLYLKQHEKNVWVAPLVQISEYIRTARAQKNR